MENKITSDNSINNIVLSDEIRSEEMHEFCIIERDYFIDELIGWISEANATDKILMKQDLKMIMNWKDKYILSSNKTNHYLRIKDGSEFQTALSEILEINENYKNKNRQNS